MGPGHEARDDVGALTTAVHTRLPWLRAGVCIFPVFSGSVGGYRGGPRGDLSVVADLSVGIGRCQKTKRTQLGSSGRCFTRDELSPCPAVMIAATFVHLAVAQLALRKTPAYFYRNLIYAGLFRIGCMSGFSHAPSARAHEQPGERISNFSSAPLYSVCIYKESSRPSRRD
jgi:hypothetical protein